MEKDRVALYIDGGNIYRKLKEIGLPEEGKRFDFRAFANHLAGSRMLVSQTYYVGRVRNFDNTERSERLVRKQQQFLDDLKNMSFEISAGKIMYDAGRIREKGVDVKIAIDIVTGASDDLYDTAIVVSSDTDLIPAIQYARQKKNKMVEYVGFTGTPSFGMIKECSSQRLFIKDDLVTFQYEKPKSNNS